MYFGVLTNRNPKRRQRVFCNAKTKQVIVKLDVVSCVYSGQLTAVMKVLYCFAVSQQLA